MTTATQTPADLVAYQRELVRTGNYLNLGRMQKIAVGPSADYAPPDDPIIRKYGRLIDLRDRPVRIGQSRDGGQILIAGQLTDRQGRVALPDLPDPEFKPKPWTPDEIAQKVKRDPAKDQPPMIVQRLTDRCEQAGGQPAALEGTNFLIFQPVLRATFQPELGGQLAGTAWLIEFSPSYQQHTALLVDHKTGEMFFLYGRPEISSAAGE